MQPALETLRAGYPGAFLLRLRFNAFRNHHDIERGRFRGSGTRPPAPGGGIRRALRTLLRLRQRRFGGLFRFRAECVGGFRTCLLRSFSGSSLRRRWGFRCSRTFLRHLSMDAPQPIEAPRRAVKTLSLACPAVRPPGASTERISRRIFLPTWRGMVENGMPEMTTSGAGKSYCASAAEICSALPRCAIRRGSRMIERTSSTSR